MMKRFKYLCSCNGSFISKAEKVVLFIVGYGTASVIRYLFPNCLLFLLYFFLALTAEMIIWYVLRKTFKRRFKKED